MTSAAKFLQFAKNARGGIAGRSAASDTRVAGLAELLEGLYSMPEKLGQKTIWGALRAAGNVVKTDAKNNAPELDANDISVQAGWRKPGTLKKGIAVSKSKNSKGAWYEVIVRVKGPGKKKIKAFKAKTGLAGAKNPDDPFYWWWVEFGTVKMAARPFMRPAFEGTKDAQLNKIKKAMQRGIEKEAMKIKEQVNRASGRH